MAYLWDYDEKELKKTEYGRIRILERIINYGPTKKGEKIRVFKYKAKSRYRKNRGHRQSHTILMVTALGDKKVQESPKPKATILADKKSPAKKPVAKKPATKKPAK